MKMNAKLEAVHKNVTGKNRFAGVYPCSHPATGIQGDIKGVSSYLEITVDVVIDPNISTMSTNQDQMMIFLYEAKK